MAQLQEQNEVLILLPSHCLRGLQDKIPYVYHIKIKSTSSIEIAIDTARDQNLWHFRQISRIKPIIADIYLEKHTMYYYIDSKFQHDQLKGRKARLGCHLLLVQIEIQPFLIILSILRHHQLLLLHLILLYTSKSFCLVQSSDEPSQPRNKEK